MKKLIILVLMLMLTGCGNYDLFDTNYTYNKAIIKLPDSTVVNVDIKQWKDYDGEQIQIISTDGTVYLTNSFNCILINDTETN